MTPPASCRLCSEAVTTAFRQGLVMIELPGRNWAFVIRVDDPLALCHDAPDGPHVWFDGVPVYAGTRSDVIRWLCSQTERISDALMAHLRARPHV